MPVMDEFRDERESIKDGTPKQKFQYFLDYYIWYVIGGIIAIIFFGWLLHDILNSKDWTFYGFFINAYGEERATEEYFNEFAEVANLDLETYAGMIDSSMSLNVNSYNEMTMSTVNRLMVSMAAGEVDFFAADTASFNHYATTETFLDMTEILPPDLLEKCEPYLYYVDMAEVRRRDEYNSAGRYDDYIPKEYDHRSPEGLDDPAAIGLYIEECEELMSVYTFSTEEVILGIPLNTTHLDTSIKFVDYIFE